MKAPLLSLPCLYLVIGSLQSEVKFECRPSLDFIVVQDTAGAFRDVMPDLGMQVSSALESISPITNRNHAGVIGLNVQALNQSSDESLYYKLASPLAQQKDAIQKAYEQLNATQATKNRGDILGSLIQVLGDEKLAWRPLTSTNPAKTNSKSDGRVIILLTDAEPFPTSEGHLRSTAAVSTELATQSIRNGNPKAQYGRQGTGSLDDFQAACKRHSTQLIVVSPESEEDNDPWRRVTDEGLHQPSRLRQTTTLDPLSMKLALQLAIFTALESVCASQESSLTTQMPPSNGRSASNILIRDRVPLERGGAAHSHSDDPHTLSALTTSQQSYALSAATPTSAQVSSSSTPPGSGCKLLGAVTVIADIAVEAEALTHASQTPSIQTSPSLSATAAILDKSTPSQSSSQKVAATRANLDSQHTATTSHIANHSPTNKGTASTHTCSVAECVSRQASSSLTSVFSKATASSTPTKGVPLQPTGAGTGTEASLTGLITRNQTHIADSAGTPANGSRVKEVGLASISYESASLK